MHRRARQQDRSARSRASLNRAAGSSDQALGLPKEVVMRLPSLLATATLLVLAAPPAVATPLDDLIASKPGTTACFTRVYEAAHLKAHPKQKIASMTVWLSYGKIMNGTLSPPDLGIGVSQRGD